MNLGQLRFARAVAETGSFSRAAAECHVTQPTLSVAIGQLEERLGARLFERTTRSVSLTPFGRELLPSIEQVLGAVEDLQRSADAFLRPDVKMVRIGLSPIVDLGRVVTMFSGFRERHPNVDIFYKECFLDDLEQRLVSEQIDIAIWPTAARPKTIASRVIYADPWVFIPSSLQPSAVSAPRTLTELAGERFVLTAGYCGLSQATRQLFETAALPLDEYPGKAVSYSTIEEWADLGIGAGLLPASKVSPQRTLPVQPLLDQDGAPALLEIEASWKVGAPLPPHIAAMRRQIKPSPRSCPVGRLGGGGS